MTSRTCSVSSPILSSFLPTTTIRFGFCGGSWRKGLRSKRAMIWHCQRMTPGRKGGVLGMG